MEIEVLHMQIITIDESLEHLLQERFPQSFGPLTAVKNRNIKRDKMTDFLLNEVLIDKKNIK